ncbi:MAG: nitroreductase family protein [Verrucomicrobiota bacterium]
MVNPERIAHPDHAILPIIQERYSPYVLTGEPVSKALVLSCLEAARWAASSFNEQPWRYILALRSDGAAWDKALSCLVEANQQWAQNAGVLILACVKKTFAYNGKPNRVAEHDLGLAGCSLTLQAQALGLHVHMMGGIDAVAIKTGYQVPDDFEPLTAIAMGYAGAPDTGEAELAKRDTGPRERMPLSAFVYGESFGQASGHV